MSSEPETQTAGQPAANSLEARLLAMDAKESKKALHGSRTLKRLGIVFYVLGGVMLVVEAILFA